MNHKQISNLKVGDRLQLKEDYVYKMMDVGQSQTITKGSIIRLINIFLGIWRFEFEVMQSGIFQLQVSFGRSRLLKLKVNFLVRDEVSQKEN